jgi:Flp pilus assembly pilin Flp
LKAIDFNTRLQQEKQMNISKMVAALIMDERGGEVAEYTVVAGLVTIAAISIIGKFGIKVLARWSAVNSSI